MQAISITTKNGIFEGKLTKSPTTDKKSYCFLNKFYIPFSEAATLAYGENSVKVCWDIEHQTSLISTLRLNFFIPSDIYKDSQKRVEFAARECMGALFDFYNNFLS